MNKWLGSRLCHSLDASSRAICHQPQVRGEMPFGES